MWTPLLIRYRSLFLPQIFSLQHSQPVSHSVPHLRTEKFSHGFHRLGHGVHQYSSTRLAYGFQFYSSLSGFGVKVLRGSVLVPSGCYTKYHKLGGLWTTETDCSQLWRLESPRSRYQPDHVLRRALSVIHCQSLHTVSSSSGRGKGSLLSRQWPHLRRLHPHDLSTCQSAYLPIPSSWKLRVSTCEFGGDTNIHTTAGSLPNSEGPFVFF